MSNQDQLFNNLQASAWLGVSPRTLERWRLLGDGPRYVRLGHRGRKGVRYLHQDLQQFVNERRFSSTSEEEVLL